MPITTIISSELIPTFIAKPDQRFATTFLSSKYRDYAVPGESIVDKTSGEMYIKRIEDGRVISFNQNHKYLHDLMLEVRVLLNNNTQFRYPSVDDLEAYFCYTDYDLVTINDDKEANNFVYDTVIPNTDDSKLHQLHFNLSRKTNGFFIRLTSRDCDKPIINWITNQYNKFLKDYAGEDPDFLAEKQKFIDIEKWADSNCTMTYNVTATKDGQSRTVSCVDYLRINEDMCVMFPEGPFTTYFPDGYEIAQIEITGLKYEKIHFMIDKEIYFGQDFIDGLKKFRYPDNNIFIRYCTIGSFVDTADDIEMLGNESLVSLVDMPYAYRYLMKMSKLKESSDIIFSPVRPSDEDWPTNGFWAEQVRDVFQNEITIQKDHEVDIAALEMYLSKDTEYQNLEISDNKFESEKIYIYNPTKEFYTNAEIDAKMRKLSRYVEEKAYESVSTEKSEVDDQGIVIEPVQIIEKEDETTTEEGSEE